MVGNVDFAAHKLLLRDDLFERHFVPTEAKRLTVEFCKVLKPLFDVQKQQGIEIKTSLYKLSDASHDDEDEDDDDDENDNVSLQRIFENALRVKAYVVLSTSSFEAIMYAPGTLFNKMKMDPRNERGTTADVHSHQRPPTKCCYLPALFEHQKSKEMVDYSNFIQSNQAERLRMEPFSKALVLV